MHDSISFNGKFPKVQIPEFLDKTILINARLQFLEKYFGLSTCVNIIYIAEIKNRLNKAIVHEIISIYFVFKYSRTDLNQLNMQTYSESFPE